jgi:hypothetical protein
MFKKVSAPLTRGSTWKQVVFYSIILPRTTETFFQPRMIRQFSNFPRFNAQTCRRQKYRRPAKKGEISSRIGACEAKVR